ncbi:unnamed protein product [Rhizopus stolonifer]
MFFEPIYYQREPIYQRVPIYQRYPSLSLEDYSRLGHLLEQAQLERQERQIQKALYNLQVLTEIQRRREQEELAIRAYYERKERERQEFLRHQHYLAMKQMYQEPLNQPACYFEQDEDEEDDERQEQLSKLVKFIFGAMKQNEPKEESDVIEHTPLEDSNEPMEEEKNVTIEPTEEQGLDVTIEPTEQEKQEEEEWNIIDPTEEDSVMSEPLPALINESQEIQELVNELVDGTQDPATFPQEDPVTLAKYEALSRIEQELEDIRQKHEAHVLMAELDFSKQGPDGMVASTAGNREFLNYEDEIMKVLLKLDTIKSEGDLDIRTERKRLVKQAEGMLETLDDYKQREWERVSSSSEDEFEKIEHVL